MEYCEDTQSQNCLANCWFRSRWSLSVISQSSPPLWWERFIGTSAVLPRNFTDLEPISEVFVPVVTLAVMDPLGGRNNEAFHFHTPLQLQVVASDSCPSTRSKSDLCGYGPAEAGMAPIDKYG